MRFSHCMCKAHVSCVACCMCQTSVGIYKHMSITLLHLRLLHRICKAHVSCVARVRHLLGQCHYTCDCRIACVRLQKTLDAIRKDLSTVSRWSEGIKDVGDIRKIQIQKWNIENTKNDLLCRVSVREAMEWLRLVGSIKLQVSFAEYRLFHRALLQKRPIIFSMLLTEATPYQKL